MLPYGDKEMRANCSSGLACPANSSEEELPEGLKAFGNLDLVFTVVSALMIGLLMFSLGCSVEVQKLWGHIRRPWGIAVGMLCQFGLMPLIAYLLIISFSLKPLHSSFTLKESAAAWYLGERQWRRSQSHFPSPMANVFPNNLSQQKNKENVNLY